MVQWLPKYRPIVLPAVLGAYFLLPPLLVKMSLKLNAGAPPRRMPIEEMPGEAYGYFGQTADDMQRLGFHVAEYLRLPDFVEGTEGSVALWLNRAAVDALLHTPLTHAQ
jgi:hypothetical protein